MPEYSLFVPPRISVVEGSLWVEEEEIKYMTASPYCCCAIRLCGECEQDGIRTKKAKRIYLKYLAVPDAMTARLRFE
jgi:hypothetical protein